MTVRATARMFPKATWDTNRRCMANAPRDTNAMSNTIAITTRTDADPEANAWKTGTRGDRGITWLIEGTAWRVDLAAYGWWRRLPWRR
jgi:hypothetical protein